MKCFMTNQDCIHERKIQDAKAGLSGRSHVVHSCKFEEDMNNSRLDLFLISPFGYPYDEIFSEIIFPSANLAKLTIKRADKDFQLGFVMCQKICKLIREAKYILADITEPNPNVYYELGLAWGFGKKVLLIRDTERKDDRFGPVWEYYKASTISYQNSLFPLRDGTDEEKAEKFKELIDRHINLDEKYEMSKHRKPSSYIGARNVCLCLRQNNRDNKFYEFKIKAVAEGFSWNVNPLLIDVDLLTNSVNPILISSKIWMVDVTHYSSEIDPLMYFTLGLAHSLGRETIPITNKARCGDISPFDVRGLWQIYFERLDTLGSEFHSILKVISATYETENEEAPLRFVWDQILEPHGRLEVFTCARGASGHPERIGGRTNVDKWDYISVAELSFFLAQKYKQAVIRIRPPEEKNLDDISQTSIRSTLQEQIEKVLKETSDSIIIIGSTDVSDYAEIVLAKAYQISPYVFPPCPVSDEKWPDMCYDCKDSKTYHEEKCIGNFGYIFYKKASSHDSENCGRSVFFRHPPVGKKECVSWYGRRFQTSHVELDEIAEGKTYGVLTIIKDNEKLFGGKNRWIILLSGYTGIGTYGLARILTQGDEMKKQLEKHKIDLEVQGCQLLISIDYVAEIKNSMKKDTRRPKEGDKAFYKIMSARPFFERKSTS